MLLEKGVIKIRRHQKIRWDRLLKYMNFSYSLNIILLVTSLE